MEALLVLYCVVAGAVAFCAAVWFAEDSSMPKFLSLLVGIPVAIGFGFLWPATIPVWFLTGRR